MSNNKVTYIQKIYEPRLFDLAKESGNVYTKALIFFRRILRKKGIFLSEKSVSRYIQCVAKRELLHSQSYQASYQKLFDNLKAYCKAKKEYIKAPSKFNNIPRMPRRRKFLQPIQFKQSAIKFKNGYLELSLSKGNAPIKVLWNISIPIPTFATIQWNKTKRFWQLNLVVEKQNETVILDPNKRMSIDLGLKRIATTYDLESGGTSVTYSGKKIKSLSIGRNKINSRTQIKLSKLKKGSRKYRKLKKSNSRVNLRIDNKLKDILHKTSRTIVNYVKKKQIGKIVIGDCSNIHNNTDCGRINNQQIQQNPEQKLKKYIEYKFKSIGGIVATVPENYTTKTCPSCCALNKPQTRIYKCSSCGFKDDRDVVGAKNILKVSFGIDIKSKLDVIGFLTKPIGWIYKTNRDCKVNL